MRDPVPLGHARILRTQGVGADVDDRIGMNEARIGIDRPDGVHRCDRGSDELHLELEPAPAGERVHIAHIASAPGQERDLVDRRIETALAGTRRTDVSSRGGGEGGEPFDEFRLPHVDIVRPSVMQQVPDHFRTRLACGRKLPVEARPIVSPGFALDQVPAQAIAHRQDTVLGQLAIIMIGMQVMLARGDDIDPPPVVSTAVGRTFEPALQETAKQTCGPCPRRTRGDRVCNPSRPFRHVDRSIVPYQRGTQIQPVHRGVHVGNVLARDHHVERRHPAGKIGHGILERQVIRRAIHRHACRLQPARGGILQAGRSEADDRRNLVERGIQRPNQSAHVRRVAPAGKRREDEQDTDR
ncbi:hypothetical protein H5J25_13660 [Sphingomonas aliaeris]|uniref:Uncharacterized protein n=1 Tax=Sphingomonas aliaeris TaxID=2759526 RepID=A0A974S3J3_9SPHN|nr:hypothetical protein [Sphingomonas aliaeris]QQV76494.1 hypothetical protein H5J25_13660 [Sphingomonas aliaeris]